MKYLMLSLFAFFVNTTDAQEQPQNLKEIKTFVITETQTNGKLDFFTSIKGKEYDGYQVKPGLYASYREMALYNWAKSVKNLGVNDLNQLYALYAEARKKEISNFEKEILKMGFNKELD